MDYQIGIDAGLETIKFVVTRNGQVIIGRLLIQANHESTGSLIKRGLDQIVSEAGLHDEEYSVAVTGIGAKFSDFPNKPTESSCCAKGIYKAANDVRTVLDMGSERSVVIRLEEGKALYIARNDRCAAGSGRFLKTAAEIMMVPLDEIGSLALTSNGRVEIESTCAVFGESEIISMIHAKIDPAEILAGIYRGMAARLYPLFRKVAFQPTVACIGGVSKNIGMLRALEKRLGVSIYVPNDALYIKAFGAAVAAAGAME